MWEALARRGIDMKLRYFRCRHELLAVSLASGYYKATGRSQIVFLPTSLGVENGSMALSTALQERTPMTVLSPDTPSDLVHELQRARFIAESVPMGPTLLEMPFQLLMGDGHAQIPARVNRPRTRLRETDRRRWRHT